MPRWAAGLLGFVVLIGLWEVVTVTALHGSRILPSPGAIIAKMVRDGWSFYRPNLSTTVQEAAVGYLVGNALAIALALLFLVVPPVEKPLISVGVAVYCLPIVAVGPVLDIVFSGTAPKATLAAMSVFFTTLVGMLVGLRSADQTALDVVHAFGGSSWQKVVKIRLRACLPSLFAALRIAAPAAVLGAIIGEYLGGDSGLGVAMINAEQAFQVDRTWGIALVATGVAGVAYVITAIVGRMATPWLPRGES